MKIEDYPPQEPFTDFGRSYRDGCLGLSAGIEGEEHAYGTDDASQRISVFPVSSRGGPVLVFIHGGGWTNGYKEYMHFLAPPLNALGISLVSVGYRLAPRHVFPANVEDVADAVAEVHGLAGSYGYDKNRIFLGGHSAGGHLSAHLALRVDWQARRHLPEDVVKGCLPISGTYDFTIGCGLSVRPRFLGPEELANEVPASPLFRIESTRVPFLIAYGSSDFPHLVTQARKFAMVLRARGVAVTELSIDGEDHLTVAYTAARDDKPWKRAAVSWMNSVIDEAPRGR